MDKVDLIKELYAQKGELVTELELLQSQLQRVNQQIVQTRNALASQPKPEEKAEEEES